MKTRLLFGCCVLNVLVYNVNCKGLKEEFTWTRIAYSIPEVFQNSNKTPDVGSITFPGKVNALSNGPKITSNEKTSFKVTGNTDDYIYENNIPMGANRWKNKLFITVPRRRLGVPSTLNYININSKERHNVPLVPYPDYETNAFQSSSFRHNRFVSVYRVAVDLCDRLWFVDTGLVEIPGNATRLQPVTLFIIDLNNDKIIRRHQFKESDLRPTTTLANLKIDVTTDNCENAYAYLPDLAGYGLVVYSFAQDRSWRITHNYFYLEPLAGEFFIGGINFQWNDGIFSLALSATNRDGYRDAYFHSMAGTHLYKVSTRILKNETLATRSYHGKDFQVVGDRGENSQTSASDIHQPSGVLFLGLVNQNALGCWNINKQFDPKNIDTIQRDDRNMIYPCDVKVYNDEVILLTNNMPIFLYSSLNYDEVNFRVWIEKVSTAIQGTKCFP